MLRLRRGPGAAGGPHASVLTFLSPMGGVLVPVLGLGGVLVQLGSLTHPS